MWLNAFGFYPDCIKPNYILLHSYFLYSQQKIWNKILSKHNLLHCKPQDNIFVLTKCEH